MPPREGLKQLRRSFSCECCSGKFGHSKGIQEDKKILKDAYEKERKHLAEECGKKAILGRPKNKEF